MSYLAITAPLSTFAAEELALRLARDAEGFRDANDDGTLLSALLAEVVNALPPTCLDKVRPALCRAGRTVAAALRLRLSRSAHPLFPFTGLALHRGVVYLLEIQHDSSSR